MPYPSVVRYLAITVLLATAGLPLWAQEIQDTSAESRSFVESVAATVYALAWPTATYENFRIREVESAADGYEVTVRLNGASAFGGGPLWMDMAFQVRRGTLVDIEVKRHNAVLAAPFATAEAVREAVATIAAEARLSSIEAGPGPSPADRQNAALLLGTWRDENSVFTYTAEGRWESTWDSGDSASGVWTLHGDTLTWHSREAEVAYILMSVAEDRHVFRSLDDGTIWTAMRVRR